MSHDLVLDLVDVLDSVMTPSEIATPSMIS